MFLLTGGALELLNRQAGALISHHRLTLATWDDLRGSPRVDGVLDAGHTLQLVNRSIGHTHTHTTAGTRQQGEE